MIAIQFEINYEREIKPRLLKLEDAFIKFPSDYVATAASHARKMMYTQFLNKPYTFNSTTSGLRFGSGWKGYRTITKGGVSHWGYYETDTMLKNEKEGYVDKMGRRLVNFTFLSKNKRDGRAKVALTSYPLNWWENDVEFKGNWGPWGPKRASRIRKGLGIIRRASLQMPAVIAESVASVNAKAELNK